MRFRTYLETQQDSLDALFSKPSQRKEIGKKHVSEPFVLKCYRGFGEQSLQRDLLSQGPGWFLLSPKKAMEGILWFTHDLQRSRFDPIEYALSKGRGGYLLTYPLQCTRHYIETQLEPHPDYWNNRDVEPPPELRAKTQVMGGSRYANFWGMIYELPEGWMFTWQVEQHVACRVDLRIAANMLTNIGEEPTGQY